MNTKNKSLIIAAVAVLGSLGLILITKPAPEVGGNFNAQIGFAIMSEERSFDFGTISMASGDVGHEFKIRNESSEAVKIDKMYTSCMCTVAYFVKDGGRIGPFGMPGHGFAPPLRRVIEAGEEAVISVVFDPAAHGPAGVGPVEREIYLEDESGNPVVVLGIKATVTP
ncbi:hypothetical protein A2127_00235 [Candidatus Jorgensenbacteria bacterium GWC1_48_12]|uniref:DUF1573 domain-containing protein n=1 Tax=Candidatus Jorgensenbacteria bacterium GWC1_48_12 TaxID=1798469 RepID=A0A1F6BRA1_9BACT|nr:MAG: hypothetical protein A2127_00235 [Candidatus Jorgensenbacteria bacterium GWC1_48_12]